MTTLSHRLQTFWIRSEPWRNKKHQRAAVQSR